LHLLVVASSARAGDFNEASLEGLFFLLAVKLLGRADCETVVGHKPLPLQNVSHMLLACLILSDDGLV
jgi:hypothetical protein